jgi:hypothetical protein
VKKINRFIFICFAVVTVFFSCAASPKAREPFPESGYYIAPPVLIHPETSVMETVPAEIPEEKEAGLPEEAAAPASFPIDLPPIEQIPFAIAERTKPEIPEYIMGKGSIQPNDMAAFLLEANPMAEKKFVENLAFTYREEAAVEGVNHDAAFAQMCLETGFLRFGGLVTAEQNNFCGLGATGVGYPGAVFPNPRMGVRAHIQHLKAYATSEPLKQGLVDPRFHYVRYGSSPKILGLSGTWAADLNYAEKIKNILERLYSFTQEE